MFRCAYNDYTQTMCIFTQVKIYKMFRILSMLDESKVERVGDVLEWVFRSALKVTTDQ